MQKGPFSEYSGSALHNYTLTIKLGAKRGLDLLLDIDICLLNVEFGLDAVQRKMCSVFPPHVFKCWAVNF